jgi:dihydroorotate dehydrogenase electron transfer subunit
VKSTGKASDPGKPAPAAGRGASFRRSFPRLVTSQPLPGGHHRLVLSDPALAAAARPGQFVHIWCHPPNEVGLPPSQALLRRPLSIARTRGRSRLELIFKVAGAGTRLLASRRPGDRLDLIGPLGNGFSLPAPGGRALLVAGGIGIAPLLGLADALLKRRTEVLLAAGARSDRDFPLPVSRRQGQARLRELEAADCRTFFVSEDKERLLISQWLEENLPRLLNGKRKCSLFAVGPWAMMRRVTEIAGEAGLRCQVSLEERMACGVGACRSCVVRIRPAKEPSPGRGGEFKTICRDGPVFPGELVVWEAEG